jgi:hypothetical protein
MSEEGAAAVWPLPSAEAGSSKQQATAAVAVTRARERQI